MGSFKFLAGVDDNAVGKLIWVHCAGGHPAPTSIIHRNGGEVLIWQNVNRTESYSYDQGGGLQCTLNNYSNVLHHNGQFHYLIWVTLFCPSYQNEKKYE